MADQENPHEREIVTIQKTIRWRDGTIHDGPEVITVEPVDPAGEIRRREDPSTPAPGRVYRWEWSVDWEIDPWTTVAEDLPLVEVAPGMLVNEPLSPETRTDLCYALAGIEVDRGGR